MPRFGRLTENGGFEMNDAVYLFTSLAAGMILGILYFRGLWQTVLRLPDFRRPAWSMSWSFVARVLFVMIGFYFVMGEHLERLGMAMAGFILARQILVRRLGRFAGPG
jgi:F1F0 ATPase subunit 2